MCLVLFSDVFCSLMCLFSDQCGFCSLHAVVAVPAGQITEEVVVEESKPPTPRKRKLEQVAAHVEPKVKVCPPCFMSRA